MIRLNNVLVWKSRVLPDEYCIFNVAIPLKEEFGTNRRHALDKTTATGDPTSLGSVSRDLRDPSPSQILGTSSRSSGGPSWQRGGGATSDRLVKWGKHRIEGIEGPLKALRRPFEGPLKAPSKLQERPRNCSSYTRRARDGRWQTDGKDYHCNSQLILPLLASFRICASFLHARDLAITGERK